MPDSPLKIKLTTSPGKIFIRLNPLLHPLQMIPAYWNLNPTGEVTGVDRLELAEICWTELDPMQESEIKKTRSACLYWQ